MTTTAEFTSTKDENYAQNSGRKGGKYTAKNVAHTKMLILERHNY